MAPKPNLQRLHEAGVSIWLDTLSRDLLESGEFAALIGDYGVTGATSNPTIFAKAITTPTATTTSCVRWSRPGSATCRSCSSRSRSTTSARQPGCCARPTSAAGAATGSSRSSARRTWPTTPRRRSPRPRDLWQRLDQPNVMIKVPGTSAGLPAIEELTRRGVNVNITLLFSIERYEQVIDAYLRGLMARAEAGEPLDSDQLGGVVLPVTHRHQGRRAPARAARRCAVGSHSPAPALPTSGTWRSSPVRRGSGFAIWAPSASGRCGRAPEPRTPTTPTCSTSRS